MFVCHPICLPPVRWAADIFPGHVERWQLSREEAVADSHRILARLRLVWGIGGLNGLKNLVGCRPGSVCDLYLNLLQPGT